MDSRNCYAHLPAPVMPRVPAQKLLLGQKALVTGASSGIGRAIALALGDAGADVVINYVSGEDNAEALAEEIRTKGVRACALRADVSDEAQVRSMFSAILEEFGTVDILVKVKEKGKNSIGFSGGVSGIAGTFIGINYATNNLFGLGETFSVQATTGLSRAGVRLEVPRGCIIPSFERRPEVWDFSVPSLVDEMLDPWRRGTRLPRPVHRRRPKPPRMPPPMPPAALKLLTRVCPAERICCWLLIV